MARPRKIIDVLNRPDIKPLDASAWQKGHPEILKRLSIHQDYVQYIAMMDLSDFFPFYALKGADQLFPKMGLVIKRQFGYLGYSWGYGLVTEAREGESSPVITAPVSLHIFFPAEITTQFLIDNAERFQKILNYIMHEWDIFKGNVQEDY